VPAGIISSGELERLSSFIRTGKALYVEGYDFPSDHKNSDFFKMLGCDYIEFGYVESNIRILNGGAGSFVSDMTFRYGHTPTNRTRTDVIAANSGQLLFSSQDSLGYAVAYDNGDYRIIVSTFLFGALADGDSINTKTELMERYMQFLQGTSSVKNIYSDVLSPANFKLFSNYPNPFSYSTTINFKLTQNTNDVSLTIFNMLGQEIRCLKNISCYNGNYSTIWNGKDNNNLPLPAGTYIYQLRVGNRSVSRKMNLVR